MESAVANLIETCPTCGTELARAKFLEVQRKLRDQDEDRAKKATAEALKEANRVLTDERKRLAEEQAATTKKAKAAEEALKKRVDEQQETMAKLKAEKAESEKKNADAIAAVRKQVEAEAIKKAAVDRDAVETKAKADQAVLKKKNEEQREALETSRETLEKLKAEKTALEKERKEIVEQAVAKAEQRKEAEMSKKGEAELSKARAALKAEHDKEMFRKMSEINRDKEAALKKIKELERKVEAKTPNSLGEGAELSIYDDLKAAFEGKGDKVKRVPKGVLGADIIQEVMFKGAPCGKIIFDSKNRQGWQNNYTSKLHDDMMAAKADYAILPSVVFPKDKSELCIQDGVMVVNPARVIELVRILRNALIRFHQVAKSNEERAEKRAKLYDFINSEQFRQKFGDATKLAADLIDIDVKEHDAHTKVWEKRNGVVKKMKSALGDIDDEISSIVHAS